MHYCLGVDLGTSFCAAAVAVGRRVDLIEVGGERRIPSTVLLTEDGTLLAGTWAQRSLGRTPHRAERNPKRYVGRSPMLLGGEAVPASRALATLLALFVEEARRRTDGGDPGELVLTHPVAWDDKQKEVLAEAARDVLPGITAVLVPEPVAAAAHYAHDHGLDAGDSVAVYDLGGGTFDTAVLTATDGGFRMVGEPGGDPEIGGESFDERVFRHLGAQLSEAAPEWWDNVSRGSERRWMSAAASLLTEARIAKETLSDHSSAQHYVEGADVDVRITRTELEDLIGADIARTRSLLDRTIDEAGVPRTTLRGVFLTGGASRTPLVERCLKESYDGLVRTWQDPKTVVALGAARAASIVDGSSRRASRTEYSPRNGRTEQENAPPTFVVDGAGEAAPVPSDSKATGHSAAGPAAQANDDPVFAGELLGAERVREARIAAGALYALGPGPEAGDLLRRIDPCTGLADRSLALGQIVGWAASDDGMLVAERRGSALHIHAVAPELVIRSTRLVETPHDPVLLVDGSMGWALVRGSGTRPVDFTSGLPWGETGNLTVELLPLGSTFPLGAARTSLGQAAFWHLNENNTDRRLLDPASPSSVLPPSVHPGQGIAVVVGQYSYGSRLAGLMRSGPVTPSQRVLLVDADGTSTALDDGIAHTSPPEWVHQFLRRPDDPVDYVATTTGLQTVAKLAGAQRVLQLSRPRNGVARWADAGRAMFGVATEHVLPHRGVSAHLFDGGRLREVGRWPFLLGNLASAGPQHAARVVARDNALWLGVGNATGTGSQLLCVTQEAQVVAEGSGWIEPVGTVSGQTIALHAPKFPPGDARPGWGWLVRVNHQ